MKVKRQCIKRGRTLDICKIIGTTLESKVLRWHFPVQFFKLIKIGRDFPNGRLTRFGEDRDVGRSHEETPSRIKTYFPHVDSGRRAPRENLGCSVHYCNFNEMYDD